MIKLKNPLVRHIILLDSFIIYILHLLEFLAEAFRCHVYHYQCLAVPVDLAAIRQQPVRMEPPSIDNGAHGTEKLLIKTQISEDCILK